jgi:hypothetical protein
LRKSLGGNGLRREAAAKEKYFVEEAGIQMIFQASRKDQNSQPQMDTGRGIFYPAKRDNRRERSGKIRLREGRYGGQARIARINANL